LILATASGGKIFSRTTWPDLDDLAVHGLKKIIIFATRWFTFLRHHQIAQKNE